MIYWKCRFCKAILGIHIYIVLFQIFCTYKKYVKLISEAIRKDSQKAGQRILVTNASRKRAKSKISGMGVTLDWWSVVVYLYDQRPRNQNNRREKPTISNIQRDHGMVGMPQQLLWNNCNKCYPTLTPGFENYQLHFICLQMWFTSQYEAQSQFLHSVLTFGCPRMVTVWPGLLITILALLHPGFGAQLDQGGHNVGELSNHQNTMIAFFRHIGLDLSQRENSHYWPLYMNCICSRLEVMSMF